MAGCGVTWCLVAVLWAQYFVGTVHTAFKPVHPDYHYSTQVQEAVRFAFSKINTESNGGPFGIVSIQSIEEEVQYIPRNMHTVFALLCFVVVIHWLIFPYPSGLLHWHCGNLTIAPVPATQSWWIWINTSFEFIINDYITTTKQSTTKLYAYLLGYTACAARPQWIHTKFDLGIIIINSWLRLCSAFVNDNNHNLLCDMMITYLWHN